MAAFRWTCPHCDSAQTVVDNKADSGLTSIGVGDQAEGKLGIQYRAVGCSNPQCGKTTVKAKIVQIKYGPNGYFVPTGAKSYFEQVVYPLGAAKPQPDYIPQPIREDYVEACLIRDLSPKASATLIRRCLQGMIRDFAGIAKNRLIDEITALRKAVDDGSADRSISIESVDAIDRVRGIGNIGAHMEKDINQIVDVDPGEAQALIELVEMLFEEWYSARWKRQQRLANIASISESKKATQGGLAAANALMALAPQGTVADLLGDSAKDTTE